VAVTGTTSHRPPGSPPRREPRTYLPSFKVRLALSLQYKLQIAACSAFIADRRVLKVSHCWMA
jgi:hypothetical protein